MQSDLLSQECADELWLVLEDEKEENLPEFQLESNRKWHNWSIFITNWGKLWYGFDMLETRKGTEQLSEEFLNC